VSTWSDLGHQAPGRVLLRLFSFSEDEENKITI
jgi:hypothetical protein